MDQGGPQGERRRQVEDPSRWFATHGVSLLIREQALSSSLLSREIRVHDLSLYSVCLNKALRGLFPINGLTPLFMVTARVPSAVQMTVALGNRLQVQGDLPPSIAEAEHELAGLFGDLESHAPGHRAARGDRPVPSLLWYGPVSFIPSPLIRKSSLE